MKNKTLTFSINKILSLSMTDIFDIFPREICQFEMPEERDIPNQQDDDHKESQSNDKPSIPIQSNYTESKTSHNNKL